MCEALERLMADVIEEQVNQKIEEAKNEIKHRQIPVLIFFLTLQLYIPHPLLMQEHEATYMLDLSGAFSRLSRLPSSFLIFPYKQQIHFESFPLSYAIASSSPSFKSSNNELIEIISCYLNIQYIVNQVRCRCR